MENATQGTAVVSPSTDLTGPIERTAKTVYHILEGAELTTADAANMTGVTWQAAEYLLNRASRVVPITKYEGRWKRFE